MLRWRLHRWLRGAGCCRSSSLRVQNGRAQRFHSAGGLWDGQRLKPADRYSFPASMTAASPTAACPSPRRRLALLLVCGLPGVGKSSFVRGLLAALAPPPDARQSERALECFSIEYDAAFARHAAPVADEDGISASASCDGGRPELSDHDIAAASAQRWHATRRHVFTECLRLLNDDGGGDSEGKSGDDLRAIPPPRRSDRLIVLDDNFYFASMRRPFYQLAQAGASFLLDLNWVSSLTAAHVLRYKRMMM